MLRIMTCLSIISLIFFSPSVITIQAEGNDEITVEEALENNGTKDTDNLQKNENNNEVVVESEDTEEVPTFESQFSWFDFAKMLLALGVVITLIYVVLRFVNQRNRAFGQARMMENLGGISLGTNRSIQLVKMGERLFVVGVGENIQLLKEIETEEEKRELTKIHEASILPGSQGLLEMWFNKKDKVTNAEKKDDFKSLFKDQLDTLAEGRKKVYDDYKRKEEK